MPIENNRLLMQLDTLRREVNREVINPDFPELAIDDLRPMLHMVAVARSAYVKELLEIAEQSRGGMPSPEQIRQLKESRETFEELVSAANALETLIQRDYLDIAGS